MEGERPRSTLLRGLSLGPVGAHPGSRGLALRGGPTPLAAAPGGRLLGAALQDEWNRQFVTIDALTQVGKQARQLPDFVQELVDSRFRAALGEFVDVRALSGLWHKGLHVGTRIQSEWLIDQPV